LSSHQLPFEPFQLVEFESWIQTTRPGLMPLGTPIGVFGGSFGIKSAACVESLRVILTDHHIAVTETAINRPATTYRDRPASRLALRYAKVEAISPETQMMNPLANGAANRWHGYVAREGLGMTRIRNQTSETSPTMGIAHISQGYLHQMLLPAFGQGPDSLLESPPSCVVGHFLEVFFLPLCSILEPP